MTVVMWLTAVKQTHQPCHPHRATYCPWQMHTSLDFSTLSWGSFNLTMQIPTVLPPAECSWLHLLSYAYWAMVCTRLWSVSILKLFRHSLFLSRYKHQTVCRWLRLTTLDSWENEQDEVKHTSPHENPQMSCLTTRICSKTVDGWDSVNNWN